MLRPEADLPIPPKIAMQSLSLHRPSILTKQLKLQDTSGHRQLRISSNLLDLFGFHTGIPYQRRVLGPCAGFELTTTSTSRTHVSSRRYRTRRNNPRETLIHERCQSFLDSAVPRFAEHVHLTIRPNSIIGRPIAPRTFSITRSIRDTKTPLEAICSLSSGIDARICRDAGFALQALIERRPPEKHDRGRDLTETGIVTALANQHFRVVVNEDIYTLNFDRLKSLLEDQPPVALLTACPVCDDHTGIKAPGTHAKQKAEDPLYTCSDMFYEVLRLVETLQPAVVWIENVPGWLSHPSGQFTLLKLKRWGYFISEGIYDPRDHGGITSRRRAQIVASVFPGFEPPTPLPRPAEGTVWRLIEDQIPFCRDVSHTKSLQKGTSRLASGISQGSARLITPSSAYAPTVLKSQARQAADSIFIHTPDGRYLLPNETVLRRLIGLDDDFQLNGVSAEVATEQIGQSIDCPLHRRFADAIRRHLTLQRSARPVSTDSIEARSVIGQQFLQL